MNLGKKTLAVLLILTMLFTFVFSGCNSGGESTADSDVDSSVDSQNEEEPSADDEEAIHVNPYAGTEYPEGEEITIWSQNFGDAWLEHFEKRVHEYNLEGRGYTVVEEFIAGAAWDERITAARASGTCPTVYIQSYNHIPTGVQSGYYAPMDDYIDDTIIDDMLPIIKDMVSIDGKTYAIPLLSEPSMLLFYRKDLLEAVVTVNRQRVGRSFWIWRML